MRQVLIKVNVVPYGGNYDVLKKAIKNFNLETSHFVGQAWNNGIKVRALLLKFQLKVTLIMKYPFNRLNLRTGF